MDFALGITGLVVSIGLGIFAVLLSLHFNDQANQAFRDLGTTQYKLQSILERTQLELPQSIASLHQLRDTLALQNHLGLSRQRILSLETVAVRERTASEVWILAVTIDYELADVYLSVIATNLMAGKKYTYFFPAQLGGGPAAGVNKLVFSLRRIGVSEQCLERYLRIFEVDEPNLLVNVTIHDPNHGLKQGYLLPVLSAVGEGFQVILDDELYDRIVPRMYSWIETARIRYPIGELDL
jgi:hypothetical protein